MVATTLNHTSRAVSGVAAIYIRHNFLAEMRKVALRYEVYVARLLGGEGTTMSTKGLGIAQR